MDNVPGSNLANGETIALYLKSALLPRFLAPDKLNAGDREIFMKYTGVLINRGTSMGISSVGDAYCNFGIYGGWVFMFLYGYLFNFTLKLIGKYSKFYPSLVLFRNFILIPWFHPAYKAGGPIQSIANMVEQFHEKISYKIFCSNTDLNGTVLSVPVNNWVKYNENTQGLVYFKK